MRGGLTPVAWGDMADHQPLRRFVMDGLSGAWSDGFLVAFVTSFEGAFFFLRVKLKPKGRVSGEPGRDSPAEDEDSEPETG